MKVPHVFLAVCYLALGTICEAQNADEYKKDIGIGTNFVHLCGIEDKNSLPDLLLRTHCAGWIKGFISREAVLSEGEKPKFCVPAESTMGQLNRVVIEYIKRRPEIEHQRTSMLALAALMKAFPC
jgi:hypothetical protein